MAGGSLAAMFARFLMGQYAPQHIIFSNSSHTSALSRLFGVTLGLGNKIT